MSDETTARVLRAASALLEQGGPEAVTNRRVAELAGVTTMAIYSRFGSKGGVLDALHGEGLGALEQAQDAALEGVTDPLERVRALCAAFRATAHAHRGHFRLVFGGAVAGYVPSPAPRARALLAFERLEGAVAAAVEARVARGPVRVATYGLFAACHGFLTLELDGYAELVEDRDAAYRELVDRALGAGPVSERLRPKS